MDPDAFQADLEAKPAALRALADALRDGAVGAAVTALAGAADAEVAGEAEAAGDAEAAGEAESAGGAEAAGAGPGTPAPGSAFRRVLFTGMGSSRFAALPVAAWLRARGADAVAEYATLEQPHPGGPGSLVVAVSASGGTPETLASLAARAPGTRRLAVTNRPGPLVDAADVHLDLRAGVEAGGVACRSFQHTLVVLLALAVELLDRGLLDRGPLDRGLLDRRSARHGGLALGASVHDLAAVCERAADASEDLLVRADRWLPPVAALLEESPATFLIAPAERRSSAEQGALMLREGPRRQADAAETGDWCHVDVYLSKPLDYRCLLFTGSRYDPDVQTWLDERDGRSVAIGGDHPGAALTLRYRHDDDPLVALLTEVLVPELLAARWWRAQLEPVPARSASVPAGSDPPVASRADADPRS